MNSILLAAVVVLAAMCVSLQVQVLRLRETTQKQIKLTDRHIAATEALITSVTKLLAASGVKGEDDGR